MQPTYSGARSKAKDRQHKVHFVKYQRYRMQDRRAINKARRVAKQKRKEEKKRIKRLAKLNTQ